MSTKRPLDIDPTQSSTYRIDDEYMHFTPLGSGQEVGRSCHILTYKHKNIMLDCGIHPAYTGIACLPFFDFYDDMSNIDVLLITHFHLDHAAALPYLLTKTNFQGRVYMTHPTKSVYKLILQDYIKVSNMSETADNVIYTEADLLSSLDQIIGINYHQTVYYNGIKFHAMNAGHVLGAAMFQIEIGDVKVLYTGDYSRKIDRHLHAAELPTSKIDVLIVEATYGVQTLQPVQEREKRFTDLLTQILLHRRGKILLPSFALGRAQEILLILDEYWRRTPALHKVPIYFASNLAKKVLAVYQTYINMMNDRIQRQSQISNPFVFQHIKSLKGGLDSIDNNESCVVMASPGMLQNGLSREILELWCGSDKNGVVITGYSVEGTLAKHIMSEPDYITSMSGEKLAFNMSVNYISFSAHADYSETKEFVDIVRPPNVILVHGEAVEGTGRLMDALQRRYDSDGGSKVVITAPKNVQTLSLQFRTQVNSRVVGKLSKLVDGISGGMLSGLVVRKDFTYSIVEPAELHAFTPIQVAEIVQTQLVPYRQTWSAFVYFVGQMYDIQTELTGAGSADMKLPTDKQFVVVCDTVLVTCLDERVSLQIQWPTNPINDMIVDSIIAIVMNIESNPAAAKLLGQTRCHHTHTHTKTEGDADDTDEPAVSLLYYLREQYGEVQVTDDDMYEVHVDNNIATVDPHTMSVHCNAMWLSNRIKKTLIRANYTMKPIHRNLVVQERDLLVTDRNVQRVS